MRTSEFIEKVEELGYQVRDDVYHIDVCRYGRVARVYKNQVNSLDTAWGKYIPNELLDVLVRYVKTPIEERKRVKKYYLYNPVKKAYFNYFIGSGVYSWDSKKQSKLYQAQFTEEEIENHNLRDLMELLIKEEVE